MPLCFSPHVTKKVDRLTQPLWRLHSGSSRSFTSTSPGKWIPDSVIARVPPNTSRAQPNPEAKSVAVVGGGITGLAAAYHLALILPTAKITLFESKKRLGGWLHTELIPVHDGEVLFEWGPRTLRTTPLGPGRHTAQLMAHLDMADDILPTSATSPASLNRYIYYPDHLVRMPGLIPGVNPLTSVFRNLMSLFSESIFEGLVPGLINDTMATRPDALQDESVGDFVTRRFDRRLADNIVSAIVHGIYAGDLYKLSVKTLLPQLWYLEQAPDSSVVYQAMLQAMRSEVLLPLDDIRFATESDVIFKRPLGLMEKVAERLSGSSVYTFKKGLAQLAHSIEAALRKSKNVDIKCATAALAFDSKTKQFRITNANRQKKSRDDTDQRYDYVVATIPPTQLSKTLRKQESTNRTSTASSFAEMLGRLNSCSAAVNVMVVNLFYQNPTLVPVAGFGYLIPRSVPIDQNPERALGVIFGSETSRGSLNTPSDPTQSRTAEDSAPGTKLTVMLGGHWWSSWRLSDLPDEQSAVKMAKAVLERHLGITDVPVIAKARMQWDAIPQYEVGHDERMACLHHDLVREFDGRLKVAGSGYQGVGVNDCVMAAKKAAFYIREGRNEATGLENFGQQMQWAVYNKMTKVMYMPGQSGQTTLGLGNGKRPI